MKWFLLELEAPPSLGSLESKACWRRRLPRIRDTLELEVHIYNALVYYDVTMCFCNCNVSQLGKAMEAHVSHIIVHM